MKTQKILFTYPDNNLRTTCTTVEPSKEVSAFGRQLLFVCRKLEGLGLAAPQVGFNVRVIAIDTLHCDKVAMYGYDPGDTSSSPVQKNYMRERASILMNPVITPLSNELVNTKEACLSVPGVEAPVARYKSIKINFIDVHGYPSEEIVTDCLNDRYGIIAQHEVDHLDGKLFIDKLEPYIYNKVVNKINKLRRK